jgi:hypothetical protein
MCDCAAWWRCLADDDLPGDDLPGDLDEGPD